MDLGQKIERLRLEKGLSRPDFCGDESELTVRQLARIESGQSQPSIPKLEYITQRLGIPAYSLMPDYKELPQGYLELKYKLLREPMYNKVEVLDKKDGYIETIYNTYFEELPKTEQLICEAMQAIVDMVRTNQPDYAVALLTENLPLLMAKEVCDVNDLILIRLFFVQQTIGENTVSRVQNNFESISYLMKKLASSQTFVRLEDTFYLRDAIISGLACFELIEYYDDAPIYIDCLRGIMEETQDYQKKPLLFMLEWKAALKLEGNYEKAEKVYQSAKLFAQVTGNDYLAQKLAEEWQKDLKKYL